MAGLLLLILSPLHSQEEPLKRILFIASYHPAFPSFHDQVAGAQSAFAEDNVDIDIEFIDSKRIPPEKAFSQFKNNLLLKKEYLPPYDGIITTDDNALHFVLDHQEELFPGLPIAFCGVNNRRLALEQNNNPSVTGVVEAVSLEETLQEMRQIFPGHPPSMPWWTALPVGKAI